MVYYRDMFVLGIETSCDETSAAVVKDGDTLLSNVVASSMDLHVKYGGVVPEIAARSHIEFINPVIDQALQDAFPDVKGPSSHKERWAKIDAIAVTFGAGLGGSLLVGVMAARTCAIVHNKPLYAINHVEAHVYANFLTSSPLPGYSFPKNQPGFPILSLIVSGKHAQLVVFDDHFSYRLLGQTQDDAIGEAFDKAAKVLGLPYPGGPSVAKAAANGDPEKYSFPKAKMDGRYDFSFSGLKTALLRRAQAEIGEDHTFLSTKIAKRLSDAQVADLAASFQKTAVQTVVDKTVTAYNEFQPKSVVIAGGVAASAELRRQLSDRLPCSIEYADQKLCTDNGAMVATLGCFKLKHGQPTANPYSLDIAPSLSM